MASSARRHARGGSRFGPIRFQIRVARRHARGGSRLKVRFRTFPQAHKGCNLRCDPRSPERASGGDRGLSSNSGEKSVPARNTAPARPSSGYMAHRASRPHAAPADPDKPRLLAITLHYRYRQTARFRVTFSGLVRVSSCNSLALNPVTRDKFSPSAGRRRDRFSQEQREPGFIVVVAAQVRRCDSDPPPSARTRSGRTAQPERVGAGPRGRRRSRAHLAAKPRARAHLAAKSRARTGREIHPCRSTPKRQPLQHAFEHVRCCAETQHRQPAP